MLTSTVTTTSRASTRSTWPSTARASSGSRRASAGRSPVSISTPTGMAHLFAETQEALRNTRLITEITDLQFTFGTLRLPHFPVPVGHTVESWLREECQRGLVARYGTVTRSIQDRLDYELGVIISMG